MDECQWLIVITPDWDASRGALWMVESDGMKIKWQVYKGDIPVSIGTNGSGWGLGLHTSLPLAGEPEKIEGDMKAPVGVFALGPLFGYGAAFPSKELKMTHLLIDERLECVDDPASRFYNAFVKKGEVSNPDWKRSEKMLRPLYTSGIVVQHNTKTPIPGKGSCIFIHKWRTVGEGTAGCTAMDEEDLKRIIVWLDAAKHPMLVQMPRVVYERERSKYQLPLLF